MKFPAYATSTRTTYMKRTYGIYMSKTMKSPQAEEIERRYRYRTLILKRKVKLTRLAATKMIGPDCAYHLYGSHPGESESG